ncbi:type III-B CRISPR-associated protein Cas10/Cmr2 [Egbenema bharatensis]|uniref:type III-B CRISPR-associated protein Cas10/Cmr2 n=1 Tax=Egbenema bharatensis TaxID=3463334 RepID=UPI003A877A72
MSTPTYTAISFAPVQGFIEKSRKLRDLFGASLILSYLSQKIVEEFHHPPEFEVISPALINHQEGMPNRILVKGGFIERDRVRNILLKHWQHLLTVCRKWVEDNVDAEYHWSQKEDQVGKQKGEWERWGSYTWEVFWGTGENPQAAMEDLETRKLKRDWTAINWVGESSSLSGTDAIAWHRLGQEHSRPGRSLSDEEQQELERFYLRLAWILDDLRRSKEPFPSDEALRKHFQKEDSGKFITPRERLSIPELVKRLATLPRLAKQTGLTDLDEGFKDIYREAGYWTGWFMGDGDKVGDKLKQLADRYPDEPEKRDRVLTRFTELMRNWGREFKDKKDLFPQGKGRVIYAGGDDFLGVLYSEDPQNQENPDKVKPIEAWNWLLDLPKQWKTLQADLKQELDLDFTYSVGFVWAGHQVPQRDILQHCREAEKRSKSLGRDRLTIRVVFNSGQYVQWTCPWDYLDILTKYRDRDGKTGVEANWNHLYSDWSHLKARHAIRLRELGSEKNPIDRDLALAMLDLYFDDWGQDIQKQRQWTRIAGDNSEVAVVRWINDLVQVGWQLCSNT